MSMKLKLSAVKVGSILKATWADGLEVIGAYEKEERGYIILRSLEDNERIICNRHHVSFEVVSEPEMEH